MNLINGGIKGSVGWSKSKFCTDSTCLELKVDTILVADSKQPESDRVTLRIDVDVWERFCRDLNGNPQSVNVGDLSVEVAEDGSARLTSGADTLSYTKPEWDAFLKSVSVGDLAPVSEVVYAGQN